jgi:hypothetical protein
MKLEFDADRIPGPRGSKTEYFLRRPRDRFVVAINCFTAIVLAATGCVLWPRSPRTAVALLATGSVVLVSAAALWRHATNTGRSRRDRQD